MSRVATGGGMGHQQQHQDSNNNGADDERWLSLSWKNQAKLIHLKDHIVKATIESNGRLWLTMIDGGFRLLDPRVIAPPAFLPSSRNNNDDQDEDSSTHSNQDNGSTSSQRIVEYRNGGGDISDNQRAEVVTNLQIEDGMFKGLQKLREFTVEEGCHALRIHLGQGSTFEGCTSLSAVGLGWQCSVIPNYTFKDCPRLEKLGGCQWPEDLARIGAFAFQGCTGAKLIAPFPESLQTIDEGAFENCPLLVDATQTWRSTMNVNELTVQRYGIDDLYFCKLGSGGIFEQFVSSSLDFFDDFDASSLKSLKFQGINFGESRTMVSREQAQCKHDLCIDFRQCKLPESSIFLKMIQQLGEWNSMANRNTFIRCHNCGLATEENSVQYCLSVHRGLANMERTSIQLFGVKFGPFRSQNPAFQFEREADLQSWGHYINLHDGHVQWIGIAEFCFSNCTIGGPNMGLIKHLLYMPELKCFSLIDCTFDTSILLMMLAHLKELKQQGMLDPKFCFTIGSNPLNDDQQVDHPGCHVFDVLYPLQIDVYIMGIELNHEPANKTAQLELQFEPPSLEFCAWIAQERDPSFPRINTVELCDLYMDSTIDQFLFHLISGPSHVQHLLLNSCYGFQPSMLPELQKALKGTNDLKTISLFDVEVEGENLTSSGFLDDMLKLKLETFRLAHYRQEYEFVGTMCKRLQNHPTLISLELRGCNLNTEHAAMLMKALTSVKCFKSLRLIQDPHYIECEPFWVEEFQHLSHIEELVLPPLDNMSPLWKVLKNNMYLTTFGFMDSMGHSQQPAESVPIITRNKHLKNIRQGEFDLLPLPLCSQLIRAFGSEDTVIYLYLEKSFERILPYAANPRGGKRPAHEGGL